MRRALRYLAVGTTALALGALAGCGTSEHIAKLGTSQVSGPTQTTPSPPSSSPLTPPTSSSPIDGKRLTSDGFSLTLPPAWHDETNQRPSSDAPVRLALYRQLPSGHRVLFTVEYGQGTVLPSQIGAAATRKSLLAEISGEVHGKVVNAPDLKVDGELAIGVTTVVHRLGTTITVSYYIPSHFTVPYPILMAYVTGDRGVAEPDLEQLVASWTWAG